MSPKKLNITITGGTGCGKSTIAAGIAAVLVEAGFNVTLDDPDINMEGLHDFLGGPFGKKTNALKIEGLQITVETVHSIQDSVEKHPEQVH